ncbi:Uncharacterized protein APZ42_008691, partial [Daphnia magna]
ENSTLIDQDKTNPEAKSTPSLNHQSSPSSIDLTMNVNSTLKEKEKKNAADQTTPSDHQISPSSIDLTMIVSLKILICYKIEMFNCPDHLNEVVLSLHDAIYHSPAGPKDILLARMTESFDEEGVRDGYDNCNKDEVVVEDVGCDCSADTLLFTTSTYSRDNSTRH